MSIQDIFYLFGIFYMVVGIIVLIIIGVVLIVIKNKIEHLHDLIDKKVDQLNAIANDPTDAALNLGAKVANVAVKKVKEAFSK